MLYQLAHIIQQHCPLLWNSIELVNDEIFSLRYRRALIKLNLTKLNGLHLVTEDDAPALEAFFAAQSQDAFQFFRPHLFDLQTIRQLIHRRSMIMWVSYSDQLITGYAFLRCFWMGKGYRGYMVDERHRGQGIGKHLGLALNTTQRILHINTYKSISPNNTASLQLAKATCQLVEQEVNENGDICYQCIIDQNEENI